MSAINFLTQGGMATISGNVSEDKQLSNIVKLFGRYIKKLALDKSIPVSENSVLRARFLMLAKDEVKAIFIFANSMSGTQLNYQDFTKHGSLEIDSLMKEVEMEFGEVIYFFTIPLNKLESSIQTETSTYIQAEKYIESLSSIKEDSMEIDEKLCFVIMSFSQDPTLQDYYERAMKPTIEKLGFRCERVDEQEFNGSIKDEILRNIGKAKFIVADVTEARPNCYYELGVAHALGKNVIHLANNTNDIHFDIKDFNFIVYNRMNDLEERLKKRIESTVLK